MTGVSLSELGIRKIFDGTEETPGIKTLFQDGFGKSKGGYLSGDFEDAYALAVSLLDKEMTPDYIRREVKKFQGMVTK
jgi:hypothetical protein